MDFAPPPESREVSVTEEGRSWAAQRLLLESDEAAGYERLFVHNNAEIDAKSTPQFTGDHRSKPGRGTELEDLLRSTNSMTTLLGTGSMRLDRVSLACFMLLGVGATVALTAVLSNVRWYTVMFGPDIYLPLTCAIYGPAFPIILMQSLFDSRFNTIYGHSAAFSCRVTTVSLLLCGCLLFMAMRKPQSALEAVILTIIIGLLSGTAYGTFMQIVTMIEDLVQMLRLHLASKDQVSSFLYCQHYQICLRIR